MSIVNCCFCNKQLDIDIDEVIDISVTQRVTDWNTKETHEDTFYAYSCGCVDSETVAKILTSLDIVHKIE